MNNILLRSIVFIILTVMVQPVPLFAECYNEDACYKDYVASQDNNNVVLAINRDTRQVELYWSNKDNTWLTPDKEHKKVLQKLYDKKLRLAEMQERLNSMQRRSIFTSDENASRSSKQAGK